MALLDIVFSLDSVNTAVGMADRIVIMVIAVVAPICVMLVFATPISYFVHRHPTVRMLALTFLILIGVTLTAEGLDVHIPKGYIYTSMTFAFLVEMLNLRKRRSEPPLELREPYAVPESIRRPVSLNRPGA